MLIAYRSCSFKAKEIYSVSLDLHLNYQNFLAYKNIVAKATVYRRHAIKTHIFKEQDIKFNIFTKLLFKWPFTTEIRNAHFWAKRLLLNKS